MLPKIHKSSICILVSGGLDSAILLGESLKKYTRVYPVYISANLRWEKAERHWLAKMLKSVRNSRLKTLKVLSVPTDDLLSEKHWGLSGPTPDFHASDDSVYLPGRNLLLLSKAGVYCALNGIPRVALGTLVLNSFSDTKMKFFKNMQKAVKWGTGHDLKILAPFASLYKKDILKLVPGFPIEFTFSCIEPEGVWHCGRCAKCAERRQAFQEASIPDPTWYNKIPN
ncbi:MAG: 7-cyano-7-deazaguanine synthase [Elusimicrobia bacterium]|nr:7-cyano-7-deazaguanine synthase [Elusimicrobiota bacterium]